VGSSRSELAAQCRAAGGRRSSSLAELTSEAGALRNVPALLERCARRCSPQAARRAREDERIAPALIPRAGARGTRAGRLRVRTPTRLAVLTPTIAVDPPLSVAKDVVE